MRQWNSRIKALRSKKKLLQNSIIRDMITQNRQRKNVHYMQEKTKEMDSALTNNMEEYRTQNTRRKRSRI